jgi:Reverse transcriptase (RNA-dependent DNA polymerase)
LKINLSNAYEQVHIEPKDVSKTTLAMVFRTYKSMVMQQGDCNVPVTFLRLITTIFRDAIGMFIHTYLNNLFVFSNTLDNHKKHLEYVFQKLCEHCLFLEKVKCNLYSERMDCLRHLVDDCSLHAACRC